MASKPPEERKESKLVSAVRNIVRPAEKNKMSPERKLALSFIANVIAGIGLGLAITNPSSSETIQFFQIFFTFASAVLGLWFVIELLAYVIKRPRLLGIVLLLATFGVFVYLYQSRKTSVDENFVTLVPVLQDSFTEAVVAKSIGGGLASGKAVQPGAKWSDVAYRASQRPNAWRL